MYANFKKGRERKKRNCQSETPYLAKNVLQDKIAMEVPRPTRTARKRIKAWHLPVKLSRVDSEALVCNCGLWTTFNSTIKLID